MTVSIILPVYNEPSGAETTIESLLNQCVNTDYEIIAVDNGSTDDTLEILRSFEDEILVYQEKNVQSSYAARNRGIRQSSEDMLAFIDADMTVPENWLDTALDILDQREIHYMGCDVELISPSKPGIASRYDQDTGFPIERYIDELQFAPTCCLFVRRNVIREVGMFDDRLVSGGDKEFGNRVYAAGYDLAYAGDVTMYHPTRDSLGAHIRKNLRVGRGLYQLQKYYPDRYGSPGLPPGPSGVKRSGNSIPENERILFLLISVFLTGIRGIGYYSEFLSHQRDRTLSP